MRSGRIISSSRVTIAKKRAVSHCGPSRSTRAGKNGVCGTPKAPTISATTGLLQRSALWTVILLLRVLIRIDQLARRVFRRIEHRHGRGVLELHDVGAL